MSKSDGGPAFPVPDSHYPNGQVQYGANGMTLRDYFAGQVLVGMFAADSVHKEVTVSKWSGPEFATKVADACYRVADAMLKEREK